MDSQRKGKSGKTAYCFRFSFLAFKFDSSLLIELVLHALGRGMLSGMEAGKPASASSAATTRRSYWVESVHKQARTCTVGIVGAGGPRFRRRGFKSVITEFLIEVSGFCSL